MEHRSHHVFTVSTGFVYCVESSFTAARKEFENCVEFDIVVFLLFLCTFSKVIKLKATIHTFFRLKIRVLG